MRNHFILAHVEAAVSSTRGLAGKTPISRIVPRTPRVLPPN
jgi:hypothetical protein